MATRIAWLLNLDSDLELGDPAGYRAGSFSRARLEELCARIADLVAPEDLLLDDAQPLAADARTLHALAFCPTPSALSRIAKLGIAPPAAPSLAVLRAVNDRAFCARLGHGLPVSCFATSMDMLFAHLASARRAPEQVFVIKRAFSFAGRERRRVSAGTRDRDLVLDASTRGFCARSFERGEGVQVEPWVDRVADFSRHGYLTRSGTLHTGPVRKQQVDAMGRFEGTSTSPVQLAPDEEQALSRAVEDTGTALHAEGYFGPFGIDAFRYRDGLGELRFNARCEINARFTMGYPRSLLLEGLADE
jgi:hypothetical protein